LGDDDAVVLSVAFAQRSGHGVIAHSPARPRLQPSRIVRRGPFSCWRSPVRRTHPPYEHLAHHSGDAPVMRGFRDVSLVTAILAVAAETSFWRLPFWRWPPRHLFGDCHFWRWLPRHLFGDCRFGGGRRDIFLETAVLAVAAETPRRGWRKKERLERQITANG